MDPYRVREATLADLETLVRHRHAMFAEMALPGDYDTMDREFTEWIKGALSNKIYYAWLAVTEEGDVGGGGGLSLLPWPPNPVDPGHRLAYVYNVYTEPAHRRRGLARVIMGVIHDWCREQGVTTIALHASEFGRPLYEVLGYRPTTEMRLSLSRKEIHAH